MSNNPNQSQQGQRPGQYDPNKEGQRSQSQNPSSEKEWEKE